MPERVTQAELLRVLEQVQGVPILVLGDIILDRYIWGKVERISPEAPVPVVDVRRMEDRLGGAANVARNLRAIGASASICGLIGDDAEGELVLKLLSNDEIERDGVIVDRTRPTSVKTRVIAQTQQVVRIDREERHALSPALQEGFAALAGAKLESSRGVVVSDYGKGAVCEPLLNRLGAAHRAGLLGLSVRPLVIDPYPTNYASYQEMSVAKPNRREAEIASGVTISDPKSAERAAHELLKRWATEMVMITLGEQGMLLVSRADPRPVFVDTVAREVFDVSGAGDTVTALFVAALAVGASPLVAGTLANIGAGIVVSEIGTVTATRDKLVSEIELIFPQ